jgi:bacteriocin biosynthesis cyclodehydratase domain-containing protein
MSNFNEVPLADAIHLKDAFGVFVLSQDEVEFRDGSTSGRSFVASDSERRGVLGSIIGKVLSPQVLPARPWNQTESDVLRELIPQLQENGILDSNDGTQVKNEDWGTYTPWLRKPLTDVRLGIVGHGVLGNAVRSLLSTIPCGSITMIESSSVANVNHRTERHLVERALSPFALGSDRPVARPSGEREWIATVQDHDWIIAAQDSFEPEELAALNQASLELRVPWSLVCFDGYEGWVGPTFVPAETACFSCFRRRLFAGAAESKNIFTDPGIQVHRVPSPWSIGPGASAWISLIASMFALEVIAAMNGHGFTLNHILVVNRLNLTFQRESVLRLPRCRDCSTRRNAPNVNAFAHLLNTRCATGRLNDDSVQS